MRKNKGIPKTKRCHPLNIFMPDNFHLTTTPSERWKNYVLNHIQYKINLDRCFSKSNAKKFHSQII